jgi:hypothetical protein
VKKRKVAVVERPVITDAAARQTLDDILRCRSELGTLMRTPGFAARLPFRLRLGVKAALGAADGMLRSLAHHHKQLGERIDDCRKKLGERP